jgi:DNA-binding response OmpR family regulator
MTKKPKILVVDDSNTNVVLLEVVLEKEGFEVATAMSAKEAFKSMEKEKPDLILLDILMPQTNGFEFLESIKKQPAYANIPVIMVSAVGNEDNKKTAKKLGAKDFFEKPIDISSIVRKINSLLNK